MSGSGSRERILKDIRGALNRKSALPDSVTKGLEARLRRPTANLKPAIGRHHVERFVEKVQAVSGTVDRVSAMEDVPAAVLRHLEAHGLPLDIVVASEEDLQSLRWSNTLSVSYRAATGDDTTSVTGAYAGVAENGTVVMASHRASPTTLNFLPDDHLIVLKTSRIVGHTEDVWAQMREEKLPMPRTLNLITGPSKTGDIEQTIYEGAHGPRRFHIILVEG